MDLGSPLCIVIGFNSFNHLVSIVVIRYGVDCKALRGLFKLLTFMDFDELRWIESRSSFV